MGIATGICKSLNAKGWREFWQCKNLLAALGHSYWGDGVTTGNDLAEEGLLYAIPQMLTSSIESGSLAQKLTRLDESISSSCCLQSSSSNTSKCLGSKPSARHVVSHAFLPAAIPEVGHCGDGDSTGCSVADSDSSRQSGSSTQNLRSSCLQELSCALTLNVRAVSREAQP